MDIRKKQIRTIYPSDPSVINAAVTNFANLATDTLYIKNADNSYSQVGSTMAERFINDFLTSSVLPSANITSDLYNWNNFRADLEFLNTKLSVLRKTITSWDTYHIAEVATDRNTLVNKLATLAPNTGLLINITPSVEINGVTYGQGDVVYCDFNGEKHHIAGASGGYYYPKNFEAVSKANNTYKMTYRFASTLPASGTGPMGADATPYEEMEKTVDVKVGNMVYFGSYTLSERGSANGSKEFDLIEDTDKIIVYPVVRIYLKQTDGSLEEILYDNTWVTYNTTDLKFTINNQLKIGVVAEIR